MTSCQTEAPVSAPWTRTTVVLLMARTPRRGVTTQNVRSWKNVHSFPSWGQQAGALTRPGPHSRMSVLGKGFFGALSAALNQTAADRPGGHEPHHDADEADGGLGGGQRPDDAREAEPEVAQ